MGGRAGPRPGHAEGWAAVLRELSVQNLALIEDARVELEPGYCALTEVHSKLGPLVDDYRRKRDAHAALRDRRLALIRQSEDRRRERALLEFEREELTAAAPKPGEPAALAAEAHRLGSSAQILEA